jgi:hypothetical protein
MPDNKQMETWYELEIVPVLLDLNGGYTFIYFTI